MFSIVLKDGKIINIKATSVDWNERTRTISLINDRKSVARINMDNIVGWVKSEYCNIESGE